MYSPIQKPPHPDIPLDCYSLKPPTVSCHGPSKSLFLPLFFLTFWPVSVPTTGHPKLALHLSISSDSTNAHSRTVPTVNLTLSA